MRIGTDIVDISRLEDVKESFVRGVLSENEIALYEEAPSKPEFLAGHYAAKEAFLKALGTGLAGGKLSEIEVRYRESGAPYIYFAGKEHECSISHDGGYAIAVCLLE
jgi:phosphopantetheine--protein transferase-like protein